MLNFMPLAFIAVFTVNVNALEGRAPARIAGKSFTTTRLNLKTERQLVTSHVLPLVAAPHPYPVAPSSRYLHKRHSTSTDLSAIDASKQDDSNPSSSGDTTAGFFQDVMTLGGRVYMTNITLANRECTVVMDTGSSDTWVADSSFQCVSRATRTRLPQKRCRFGTLYDADSSSTINVIDQRGFGVKYTDGEFLSGMLGTEELGIGGVDEDRIKVRQTIGVVQRGWWMGDGVSNGLMGLAFPTLASNVQALNYTSIMWTLCVPTVPHSTPTRTLISKPSFEQHPTLPAVFSLALSRPTLTNPTAGGLLAIGGIPDIPHSPDFVTVPIRPILSNTYAFYSVPISGFDITPPALSSTSPPILPLQNYTSYPLDMIIDSGSSLLRFPDQLAEHIASLFVPPAMYAGASDTYLVPCSAKAPRVGVVIGGKSFFVAEEDLMNKGPGNVRDGGQGMCTLAVLRQGRGDAVLGDSWLVGVLAVFDVGRREMRFAGREGK
jgi:hypothetical protein